MPPAQIIEDPNPQILTRPGNRPAAVAARGAHARVVGGPPTST
eukprot:COSAG03_NODE_29103_length_190_cov_21.142857_1_plen_42_part_10